MSVEYWKAEFVDRYGTRHWVCGSEEVMRQAIESWKSSLAVDGCGPKCVEVHGSTDSYDRGEVHLLIRAEDIVGASLVRMT